MTTAGLRTLEVQRLALEHLSLKNLKLVPHYPRIGKIILKVWAKI